MDQEEFFKKFSYEESDDKDKQQLVGFIDIANEYIIFKLGNELYAIEILKVKEITGLLEITSVPKMPEYIKGVINLRGDIIPVIDLALKLTLKDINYGEFSVIIVIEIDNRPIGILAQEILDVHGIEPEKISNRVDVGLNMQAEFIQGIANVDNFPIMILNIGKLLNLESIPNL